MKKALIVDDIKENLYLLESLLKGNGYATVTANNGAEALGLALKEPPDIIIADILMPVMDGYTLCREWKKDNILRNIPFVFYTATYTHPKDEEFALSLGADKFIIKPQEPDDFMAIIEQVMSDFSINKPIVQPSESLEITQLKEYNETLIRKMENRMLKSDDAEKKIRIYATQLETEIEHRKQVEKAIQQSEEKYRHIFENIQDVYYESTIEGTILEVSPSIRILSKSGYSCEDLIGNSIYDFYSNTDSREALLKSLSERGSVTDFEINLKNHDGTNVPCSVSAKIQFDANGWPLKIIGSMRDITERKQAEEILIENEAKYRTLVTQSPDGIFIMDLSGTFLSVNKSMCENLRYSEEEFLTMKLWDIVPMEYMSIHKNRLAEILKGERKNQAAEYEVKGKDGVLHSIEVLSAPYYKDKVIIGFQGIARDITEKKRVAEALQENEKKLKELLDNAPIGYHELDSEGRIAWINRTELNMLGYTEEEMIGHFVWEFIEDNEISKQRVLEKLKGIKPPSKSEERIYHRKDRTTFTVMVEDIVLRDAANRITGIRTTIQDISKHKQAEEEITMLSHSLKSINECVSITDLDNKILFVNESFLKTYGYDIHELIGKNISIVRAQGNEHDQANKILQATIWGEWQGECINRKKDGSEFMINLSTTVIKDKEDKILGLIGVATDITERKLAEQELIEAKNKAEESDRLKSAFLANMSHEVRTPLNSIIGFSELLADSYFDEEQKKEFIQTIIASGNSLLNIISDIMDLSKMQSGEIKIRRKHINVLKFISGIKEQFTFQTEEKKLEFKLICADDDEETIIFTDSERLSQIFNNLISNAIKFTTDGGIDIGYQTKGKKVEFYVKDTGIGIPEEYHEKIFERFRQVETEKTRKYGGNGLGLAITKNLVELMGGKIWIESETGKGSVFYFTIPCNNELEEINGI